MPTIALLLGASVGVGYESDVATALGGGVGLFVGLLGTRVMPTWVPVPEVRLQEPWLKSQSIVFHK